MDEENSGGKMLKQMIEFTEKASKMSWNEEKLRSFLENRKNKFFFAVDTGDDLEYIGFHIIGVENPFPEGESLSKKFVNLEIWMGKNKELIKYTEFLGYRRPVGSHNSCIGSTSGLGTVCISHFELEKGSKIEPILKKIEENKKAEHQIDMKKIRKEVLKVFHDRISNHVKNINEQIIQERDIKKEKLQKMYTDFFNEIINGVSETTVKQIFKHEVVIFSDKILGIRQEGKTKNEGNGLFEMPKYFNIQKAKNKPFVMESRTRPIKENLLISTDDQKKIHKFMVKILPEIGSPFVLPLEDKYQRKMADNIARNEKNFFKTIENLFTIAERARGNIEDRFDFYFVDIRNEKIQFFDYVSNYQYYFSQQFYEVFPLIIERKSIDLNRKDLKGKICNVLGQKNLSCLPWVPIPKRTGMNTQQKSAYINLREKLFETIYLGENVLTRSEVNDVCIMLIENGIISENNNKAKEIANECLNLFINSYLYTIGDGSMENSLISNATKIEEQIKNNDFKPSGKESGFYLMGWLIKRLCDKSETSNEKSRLLQPIINTHTFSGLNRVVIEKFVEKYAYKIEEKDKQTTELISKVLPFFAEQNNDDPIKDYKPWLYAGFFSAK